MNALLTRVPFLLVAVLCFLATTEMPYGYYKFVRWVVMIASIVVMPRLIEWIKNESIAVACCVPFVVLLLVFNPFFPFKMHREIWFYWDIAAGVFFAGVAIIPKGKR